MTAEKAVAEFRSKGLPLPSPAWLAQRYGITQEDAEKMLGGHPIAPQVVAKKVEEAPVVIKKPEPPTTTEKKSLREHVQGLLTAILPFVFFGAALAGSYRSFTLCYGFFARYNPADGAFTMSVLLVAIAFATPQAVPILWDEVRRGKRIFLFILVILLSGASIGTNVLITATELQSQRADSLTADGENAQKREQISASILELERQRAGIEENLGIDKEERRILMEAQKALEVGSINYNRTRNNISELKNRIDLAEGRIAGINEKIGGLRSDLSSIKVTAGGVVAGEVESIVSFGASLIIEVGGPVALSLSLFL